MRDDREAGPSEITEEERHRLKKADQDMTATQLGCLVLLLALPVFWFAVAHLFEWSRGWRDTWW